jgi:methyl-accepting chemotaxis protein
MILTVLAVLAATLIYMQVKNTDKASEEAIGNFSMRMAEAYAEQFDLTAYGNFLKDPQENEAYWSLREELNRYRLQIGALYVYTVQINDPNQPLIGVDGQPRDSESASPIGEITDMPKEAAEAIRQGQSAKSGIIMNPEYGDYISSYAPLRNADGAIIGALGIDTALSVSKTIYRDVLKQSTSVFVIMGVLTILFFLLIVLFLSRALRPLGTIVKGAEAIARGDLAEAQAQLGAKRIKSRDEIGQAYAAMLTMVERLGVTLRDVMSDIALTAQNLVQSSDQFRSEARQMVDLNGQLGQSIVALTDGALHQRVGAEQSAQSVEEMTAGIQRASEASARVTSASGEALDFAEEGKDSIHQLREQVVSMSEVALQTAQSVEVLNASMGEIEPVLGAIAEIADQTKLLALNAAIEAARAGEHGAGFAVVAGEVRKLAEASAVSAARITALLLEIKRESAQIGERMQRGSAEMLKGSELSQRAELLFNDTMNRFVLVNGQIQEISAVFEEVLAGSEEVAASSEQMARISAATAENTAALQRLSDHQSEAAQRIAETTDVLQKRSAALEAAVEKFKL